MYKIIKNKDKKIDSQNMREEVRVKALIINSKKEILLAHSYLEYQFVGGHVMEGETLCDALKRELKEETGLDYDTSNLECFCKYEYLGNNYKRVIYYYEINDDRIPDLKNTNYTEEEKDGNFKLRYVPLNIVKDVLKRNMLVCGDASGIAQEMLEVFDYYLG